MVSYRFAFCRFSKYFTQLLSRRERLKEDILEQVNEEVVMKRDSIGVFAATVLAILILIPGSAQAVEDFKVSEFDAAIQIWFEAEDFDERNPEGDRYYKVTAAKDAFGKAITRAGGAGGMIRWDFNISYVDGEEGTWYFWARIKNPSNQSDYMLVEGDPEDELPNGPPFPGGDSVKPFVNPDDRIFEANVPQWRWWGKDEGATKELQSGKNSMYIYHRQGSGTVFWDVFMWTNKRTYVPSNEHYENAKPMKTSELEPVEPMEKLSTTWGSIRSQYH